MATAIRRADAHWEGTLTSGGGTVRLESVAGAELPVSWRARVEDPTAGTSPEELLAAAQASCFAMALASLLATHGRTPDRLEVSAEVYLDPADGGGFRVSRTRLHVEGVVRGMDADEFSALAGQAAQGCPVSAAMRGNVDIAIEAALAAA